jgi:hypothetical protein
MAGLPDGTYIILNGAQHGAAGMYHMLSESFIYLF